MFIMLSSFVVARQIYLFIMANFIANEFLPIAMSYPAGWLVCSIIMSVYYRTTKLDKKLLVDTK